MKITSTPSSTVSTPGLVGVAGAVVILALAYRASDDKFIPALQTKGVGVNFETPTDERTMKTNASRRLKGSRG